MPKKPSRWCNRCKAVHGGDCPDKPVWLKPVRQRSGRGGRPWRRKREQVFERDGYLCQEHQRLGVTRVVTLHGPRAGVCDHIIPKAEGGTDADSNLQTLCQSCSDEKTHQESQRGRGGVKP